MYQAPPSIPSSPTLRVILKRIFWSTLLVLPLTWAAMFWLSRLLWPLAGPWHVNEGIWFMLVSCAAPFFIGAGTLAIIAIAQAPQPDSRWRRPLFGCGITVVLYIPVTCGLINLIERLHPVPGLKGNDFSPESLLNAFIAMFISSALITAISTLLSVVYHHRHPQS